MGEHILLVEHNGGLRHALKLYLELDDYEVRTAASLEELDRVLDTLEAPPSLVISDLHLGRRRHESDVVGKIRRRFQRQVPAILLIEDTPKANGGESGAAIEMLGKPVDPKALLAAVDGLLART